MTQRQSKQKGGSKFTIGELAEELNLTTRTIRYYEERGMITPGRTEGGQRFYTRRERGRLKLILRGKAAGLDLSEIKEVVEMYDVLPDNKVASAQGKRILELIDKRVAEIDQKVSELAELKKSLLDHREAVSNWK